MSNHMLNELKGTETNAIARHNAVDISCDQLNSKYKIQEKVVTVSKKHLFLVLPYLGPLSLQTKTKFRKSLKCILNCCKLQIVFKS